MTAAAEKDTAMMDAAFDEAAAEMEAFISDCISKGYSALVIFGNLEAHRYALRRAALTHPITAMAEMLGKAEAERGKGLGRIPPALRQAVRPPSTNESAVDASSRFRGIDHQFTEGLMRLDDTLERLLTKHAGQDIPPLPVFAALVMWTELLLRALKEGGTSWWARKKAEWSAHAASEQMLRSVDAPG